MLPNLLCEEMQFRDVFTVVSGYPTCRTRRHPTLSCTPAPGEVLKWLSRESSGPSSAQASSLQGNTFFLKKKKYYQWFLSLFLVVLSIKSMWVLAVESGPSRRALLTSEPSLLSIKSSRGICSKFYCGNSQTYK